MKNFTYSLSFLLLVGSFGCARPVTHDFDFFNPPPDMAPVTAQLEITKPEGSKLTRSLSSSSPYSGENLNMSVYSRDIQGNNAKQDFSIFIERKTPHNTQKMFVLPRNAADYANIATMRSSNAKLCGDNAVIQEVYSGNQNGHDTFTFLNTCGQNNVTHKGSIAFVKVISGDESFFKIVDTLTIPPFDVKFMPSNAEQFITDESITIERIYLKDSNE